MKCRNCGNTEVGIYKEIRGIIAEMGITKEDIQKEIKATIDSYVRSAMSEDINNYVQTSVKEIVKKEIAAASWDRPSKVQEILKECLRDMVAEELRKSIDFNVNVREKEKTPPISLQEGIPVYEKNRQGGTE